VVQAALGEECDGTANSACACSSCYPPGHPQQCTCAPQPVCGNNIIDECEICDGTDTGPCPGDCDVDCTCMPQPLTVQWFSVDGGGGTSTGGTFTLRSTIGQHDAGELTGGTYAVSGGFHLRHADSCPASSPAVQDNSPSPPDTGSGTKNRYLSFAAGDPGRMQAVRVTITSLPGFEYAEGRAAWVQEPVTVTEASGSSGPSPEPTHLRASLGCTPFYADWSAYGVVDVIDDGIIPGGTFTLGVIQENCSLGDESAYSAPIELITSATGDIVGDCGVNPCSAPQGVVDFVDISAVVSKFRNEAAAPRKARADLINSDVAVAVPDGKVDFVDISYCVDAFRNAAPPPPGPPLVDPCD